MNTLAVTDETLRILKNFAGVSNSLLLKTGEHQKTVQSTSVVARAVFTWPQETAIYDLNAFLGAVSLFGNPEIVFEGEHMALTGKGGSKIKFRYSDPSTIPPLPAKELPCDNPDVQFKVSAEILTQMKKTVALLKLTHITVTMGYGNIIMSATTPGNAMSHQWELSIPAGDVLVMDDTLQRGLSFKVEHIALLMEGSYTVSFARGWKWGYFEHASVPISYYIVEQSKG